MRALDLVAVEAPALDAAGHMGLDEALLGARLEGRAVLRFYRWLRPGVTFGYGQRWELARQLAASRGMGSADLVRRATGGGVVFHDGDVTFSLVFPWERLSSPGLMYKDIHRGVHTGLKAARVLNHIWTGQQRAAEGGALERACFGGVPEKMDLVRADGLKILGGALRRRGAVGLYQGSFRPDLVAVSIPTIHRAIAGGLASEFSSLSFDIAADTYAEGERLAERYRSDRWNKKR